MKILVYRGKHGHVYFDATESDFLDMFKYIDELNYYVKRWMPSNEWALVEKARTGDEAAAYDLLRHRSQHEYEGWSIESVHSEGFCPG